MKTDTPKLWYVAALESADRESKAFNKPLRDVLVSRLKEAQAIAKGKPIKKVNAGIVAQAGRKTKKPTVMPNPQWLGFDIFADDFRKILVEESAPASWSKELPFIMGYLFNPSSIDGIVVVKGFSQLRTRKVRGEVVQDQTVRNAVIFAHLFSLKPECFARCAVRMFECFRNEMKKPSVRAAFAHAANPEFWEMKAARAASLIDDEMTERGVEDGRELLRSKSSS